MSRRDLALLGCALSLAAGCGREGGVWPTSCVSRLELARQRAAATYAAFANTHVVTHALPAGAGEEVVLRLDLRRPDPGYDPGDFYEVKITTASLDRDSAFVRLGHGVARTIQSP